MKKRTKYSIYLNAKSKKAMEKASEKEFLSPRTMIELVFRDWLKRKGYLK